MHSPIWNRCFDSQSANFDTGTCQLIPLTRLVQRKKSDASRIGYIVVYCHYRLAAYFLVILTPMANALASYSQHIALVYYHVGLSMLHEQCDGFTDN